jgi:predicted HicB family RNase H-like nuclease
VRKISETRTIAFRVDEEFHTAVKVQAAKEKKTLQDYIIEILKKDLEEKQKAKSE